MSKDARGKLPVGFRKLKLSSRRESFRRALSPSPEEEEDGLDQLDHGEAAYHFEEGG